MSRSSFQRLCEKLAPQLQGTDTNVKKAIPVEDIVALSVRLLVWGERQRAVEDVVAWAQSTISKHFKRFLAAVASFDAE